MCGRPLLTEMVFFVHPNRCLLCMDIRNVGMADVGVDLIADLTGDGGITDD